ncbi:MAG: divalent-cation tolerance protein CutA [Thermodesulfobacteriota bacterium]|nr:divalent-cation tolerance protein CutA [Thermodesulfobacteriota bacterium]
MEINLVYVTLATTHEAKMIGKRLVSDRLAAGVNIIDNINSIYWWDGDVQEAREAILIAKTKKSLVPELIEKVKSLHSYSCPCVVSLPVLDGYGAFLDWVAEETK